MATTSAPPILSTPSEHVFHDPTASTTELKESKLSEEELYIQYEIPRTIREIRDGRWKRIALQFPDEMLVDAPRVFERLRDGLARERAESRRQKAGRNGVEAIGSGVDAVKLEDETQQSTREADSDEAEEKLTILADTSYGACCVDEIAAEHVDADVVVHYGRSCLSPTARLPVIYVFTPQPLNMARAIADFKATYPDLDDRVCLMADIPYHHHVETLYQKLRGEGYTNLFPTEIQHDPSSLLPNRSIPPSAKENAENLKEYSIYHISTPPTPLLLTLTSRVRNIHIHSTSADTSEAPRTTIALLRRRYAALQSLPSTPTIGILINTLSVRSYLSALTHLQSLLASHGKKAYTFVVGKVNVAKLANFSEIGAWVVISCWESSLLEGLGGDFMAPVVTPFELEVALKGEGSRVWGGEWEADFGSLLKNDGLVNGSAHNPGETASSEANWADDPSDDEEPTFDLRTGRYVSRSRPMGKPRAVDPSTTGAAAPAPPSSALVQRAKGDVAVINGVLSPGAEFLREKRTWTGLGSDYEIAYERDEEGKIRGAAMEVGRSGVAKGYDM
ncbi:diphthamide biosynthesis protein-like protein [Neohortaea acidophila]|uniref:2-(3-amino-3-carboxypropyl)histidine synthase subunit 2 n=1 Tax=Neohortaea acidophila TaxID=245834 RepID=A0A6A6PRX3_9PEZI|nr:diphthamide biosynthesis protein-like protein [Neohortaea acidophila]KAF2482414.1 diphthamide biosynthesis protein-like protein [Neohortaea acidophila]